MLRFVFPVLFCCLAISPVFAQRADSLFVVDRGSGWTLEHKARKGETLIQLSRRYHVPAGKLADLNKTGAGYQDPLKENTRIVIPLGGYNLQNDASGQSADIRPLYYRVQPEDNLYRISRNAGVPQRKVQVWNRMTGNEVEPGEVLQVGWLLYDATQPAAVPIADRPVTNLNTIASPHSGPPSGSVPPTGNVTLRGERSQRADTTRPDTMAVDTVHEISAIEQLYLDQTANEQNVVTEKGAAAFFNMSAAAAKGTFYAFHNNASKGTIIKVHNPGTGKTVFVKVLGPLPGTKQYANAVIGISGAARAALGVRDVKAWCVLSYAGY